jgi:predicted metalloprotease with PDZ domain
MRIGSRWILWSVVALATLLAAAPEARAQTYLHDDPGDWAERVAVEYHVSLERVHAQLVDVRVEFPARPGEALEFRLPTWRPGKYLILDPSGTIVDLRAEDGAGGTLRVRKLDKSTWRVSPSPTGRVVVSYTIYANSLNDRTRHADDTHAFLSGSSVFIYNERLRSEPVRVRVDRPEGWEVATGLAEDPTRPDAWLAPDYDVLVDSPLEIGEHELIGFSIDGTPHDIVIWGPSEADAERLASDFAAITRVQRDIFEGPGGRLPYQRYVFMIHCQPGIGGGTEHLNSTIMHTRPTTFTSDSAYERFLGLVSHEMFHTWNVKRLRPAGLTPYDYQQENYTDLLWVAEGTTSYYDDVTLVRAGLIEPDRYLAIMSRTISNERRRPGGRVQSLADSSYDAWIKYNRSTPHDINATVSFYSKGALVSLMLDMEIRRFTDNRASFDDVLRTLYRRFPLESGASRPTTCWRCSPRSPGEGSSPSSRPTSRAPSRWTWNRPSPLRASNWRPSRRRRGPTWAWSPAARASARCGPTAPPSTRACRPTTRSSRSTASRSRAPSTTCSPRPSRARGSSWASRGGTGHARSRSSLHRTRWSDGPSAASGRRRTCSAAFTSPGSAGLGRRPKARPRRATPDQPRCAAPWHRPVAPASSR